MSDVDSENQADVWAIAVREAIIRFKRQYGLSFITDVGKLAGIDTTIPSWYTLTGNSRIGIVEKDGGKCYAQLYALGIEEANPTTIPPRIGKAPRGGITEKPRKWSNSMLRDFMGGDEAQAIRARSPKFLLESETAAQTSVAEPALSQTSLPLPQPLGTMPFDWGSMFSMFAGQIFTHYGRSLVTEMGQQVVSPSLAQVTEQLKQLADAITRLQSILSAQPATEPQQQKQPPNTSALTAAIRQELTDQFAKLDRRLAENAAEKRRLQVSDMAEFLIAVLNESADPEVHDVVLRQSGEQLRNLVGALEQFGLGQKPQAGTRQTGDFDTVFASHIDQLLGDFKRLQEGGRNGRDRVATKYRHPLVQLFSYLVAYVEQTAEAREEILASRTEVEL